MRWLSIIASLALACAPSVGAAAPRPSPQTNTPTSSTPSKPTSHKKNHHSKREPTQKAPTADRISEIQSALAHGGYYLGEPNGKWDSNTVAAVQKFQSANGIEANGKLDAPTLQRLGLGSDIAGVSAPKAAAPPSCCSTSPAAPTSGQTSTPATAPAATAANEPGRQN
ncbi:MAG TPA: peptidoglycan-binding domain-containing protein [Candidatus Acidoferrales bacterium]|jgi:peptidoglycan hydrolase-like protein with peptidoglycan-binding domain|nr:peptidoglycan-binding domain-containing protein [Candidatus Acidoferrales bacterium]